MWGSMNDFCYMFPLSFSLFVFSLLLNTPMVCLYECMCVYIYKTTIAGRCGGSCWPQGRGCNDFLVMSVKVHQCFYGEAISAVYFAWSSLPPLCFLFFIL